jgi:hypothetical protein
LFEFGAPTDVRKVEGYPLWIGHAGDVADPSGVLSAGIRAIVSVAPNELPSAFPCDLVYCRFPLVDGAGNPAWLLRTAIEAVACLVRCDTPTLVVCGAGMSRSPSVAAAAISVVRACALNEALRAVLRSGPADVSPGLWSEIQAITTTPTSSL